VAICGSLGEKKSKRQEKNFKHKKITKLINPGTKISLLRSSLFLLKEGVVGHNHVGEICYFGI